MVKNLPASAGDAGDMGFLCQEVPLGEEMATTPVFLPGQFHELRSLEVCTVHGVTKSWT